MPLVSQDHRVAFFPIPKVASTSIRYVMYELIHGEPFRPRPEDGIRHIHQVPRFGFGAFDPRMLNRYRDYFRFTVLRDPLERLASAHAYIFPRHFIRKWEGETLAPEHAHLSRTPDLETFFLNIRDYMAASRNLAFHVSPYAQWVGADLSAYQAVFRIEETARIGAVLGAHLGRPVEIGQRNRAGDARRPEREVSRRALLAALDHCRDDYAVCRGLYAPPG